MWWHLGAHNITIVKPLRNVVLNVAVNKQMLKYPLWPHLKNVHLEAYFKGTVGSGSHNFAFCLICYVELLCRTAGVTHCTSTELFYFWSDDLGAWCFKYYRPCSSSYIYFHGASTLIWSSSGIRDAHHCPSLLLNWKCLQSDCQILIYESSTCEFNLLSVTIIFHHNNYKY